MQTQSNMPTDKEGEWQKVSFAADCTGEDDSKCSVCGDDYDSCDCPGPTHDGYEYAEFGGVLFAKLIARESPNAMD